MLYYKFALLYIHLYISLIYRNVGHLLITVFFVTLKGLPYSNKVFRIRMFAKQFCKYHHHLLIIMGLRNALRIISYRFCPKYFCLMYYTLHTMIYTLLLLLLFYYYYYYLKIFENGNPSGHIGT